LKYKKISYGTGEMMKSQKLGHCVFVLTFIFISTFLLSNSSADPLDNRLWRNPLTQVGYVSKINYANGMFFAVGGAISSSLYGVSVRLSDLAQPDSENGNCAATLSSDLQLHVPVVSFYGQSYSADFQVITDSFEIQLTNYDLLTDISPFANCRPALLSPELTLHIPTILFGGVSYLADFQYSHDSVLTLIGFGQTASATPYQLAPASTYQEGCVSPCLCPVTIGEQITGSFNLIQLNPIPLFSRFGLNDISWTVTKPDGTVLHTITGFGIYQTGGEFAKMHQLILEISIDNSDLMLFDSGLVPDSSQFPAISISVDRGTSCFDILMSIIASPS
jgi:hypothetical protein